jgi:hypothetical protein
VERTAQDDHTCDPDRRLDYLMFSLREEIATFEGKLHAYLRGPKGQFDTWMAAQEVRRTF